MVRLRWVGRTARVALVGLLAAALARGDTRAAPVPKERPREEVILFVSGYGVPVRLMNTDGKFVGELPFASVYFCALSPGGTHAAVVTGRTNGADKDVYIWRIGSDPDRIGEPLVAGLKNPNVAWGAGDKLYVGEFLPPPGGSGYLRPLGVTTYDLSKRATTVEKALQGGDVRDLSPDGKRLLFMRFVAEPVEKYEPALLDATTLAPLALDAGDVSAVQFLGPDRLLGTRPKKGAVKRPDEYVVFDLATKRVTPVPVPMEVRGGADSVFRVLPSPDGRRVLFCWTEEVPAPEGWPGAGPFHAARMTIADLDGRNARTIFRPEIKTRDDEVRNHIGSTVDWR